MKPYMKGDAKAMLEDMSERPKFYKYLKGVHGRACSLHGKIPYELVRNQFWASVEFLTARERNILVGFLVYNLGGDFYKSIGIKPSTAKTIRIRAIEKIDRVIFSQLEVEKIISGFTKRGLFE